MKHQKQKQKLDGLIGDLERELSESKSRVVALEETHERLGEMERICQELSDENRRLREEITSWQERMAKSEENQRQVSMLQQQLDALQAEHARVIDRNHQLEGKLTGNGDADRVSPAVEDNSAEAMLLHSKIHTDVGLTSDLSVSDKAGGDLTGSSEPVPKTDSAKETKASQIVWMWGSMVRNWRFGAIFAGLIVLTIAGAVTMKNLRSEAPISRDPVEFSPEATTVEQGAEPVSKPPIKAAPRVRGAFQTVRPTQVFSGPSEDSELIIDLGKGTKVNVVDSRDGWLEIHSKHGRPPGFIRQEAAIRIGSN
jgi:hypothetical protein